MLVLISKVMRFFWASLGGMVKGESDLYVRSQYNSSSN